MKKLFALALVFFVGTALAQKPLIPYEPGKLIKTYTTYVNGSDDTTGFITVPVIDVMNAAEVGLLCVTTDSVQAAVYVIGTNRNVSAYTTTYTDSISTIGAAINGASGFASTPYAKFIMIKGPTLDRIPGCTRFKVGTVFTAAVGDRAGRTCKWYLYWKQ